MIISYPAEAPEVRAFRNRIYEEDLGLSSDIISTFDRANPVSDNEFAYWYSDQKFLTNGFDQVMIFHWDGEPVGLCGGTLYNKYLYRGCTQYYILSRYRKMLARESLLQRPGGFMPHGIDRATELGCKAYFVCMHTYDRRHARYWEGLRRDLFLGDMISAKQKQYSAKDFVFLEKEYEIMYTKQRVFYRDLNGEGVDFDDLYNFGK
jgi:hypothetical protein